MICLIDCGTSWLAEIKACIPADISYDVIPLSRLSRCDFGKYAGVIISGAPTSLTQVDLKEYLKPFQRLKDINFPIFGICLGHQILGLLHGSSIRQGAEHIDRLEPIEILIQDPIFSGIENHAQFREDHSEHISVPVGFSLLAKSATCINEAMKHRGKLIYGVQFHPEVSGRNGRAVLRNFLSLCRD